jgi:hypothetical protein
MAFGVFMGGPYLRSRLRLIRLQPAQFALAHECAQRASEEALFATEIVDDVVCLMIDHTDRSIGLVNEIQHAHR